MSISFFFRSSIDDTVDCRLGSGMLLGSDRVLDPYEGTIDIARSEGIASGV